MSEPNKNADIIKILERRKAQEIKIMHDAGKFFQQMLGKIQLLDDMIQELSDEKKS